MSIRTLIVSLLRSDQAHEHFIILNKLKLLALALLLTLIWIVSSASVMTTEEELAWDRVKAAQQHLVQWRTQHGTAPEAEADLWKTGLIGVEWSGLTTTLGDLEAKRTACHPTWAIQYRRWFQSLGLKTGDPVSIFSSSSFPGLLLSALVAAESLDLDINLIVSLGSSTWGANHPDSPWPVIAAELRYAGFVRKRADYYTLGGNGERGGSLSPEGAEIFRTTATGAGVELLTADSLEQMTALKFKLLQKHKSKLLISIGGSHANMGNDENILSLPPGLITSVGQGRGGDGVIGLALDEGMPVIHMLNLKRLSTQIGLPYDSKPEKYLPGKSSLLWSVVGLSVFLIVMWRYRRWQLDTNDS